MAKKAGKSTKPAKTVKPSKTVAIATKPRRVKPPKHNSLRPSKRYRHPVKLPSAWALAKASAIIIWQHRKLFTGIVAVYAILNLILVQGLANSADVNSLKASLSSAFTGNLGSLGSSLSIFAVLVGSAGNGSSPTAGAYQAFLALITSLAVIWALRQIFTGSRLRVRDPYYRGMYPLIPFILVLLVIGLQLIPLLIGSSLYNLVTANNIAVHSTEKAFWTLLFAGLALISFYMVTSSIFALYMVTLPDMTPRKALRSAKQLVKFRRWTVLRKIACLPVILLIVAAIIMVPIIIWLTPLTQWVFFILTTFALVAAHTYMYTLYRELLNE